MTHNQIDYWKHREDARHNVATETETNRHNVRTEDETERHNRQTESVDLGKLNETVRHNKATEGLTGRDLDIKSQQLGLTSKQVQELQRHNLASEALAGNNLQYQYATLSEINRHNVAQEGLSGYDLNIKAASQQEAARHNVSTEQISKYSAVSQAQVNESVAAYNDVRTTWAQLESSANVKLTDAKRRQVNKELERLDSQIGLLESQKTQTDLDNFWRTYDEIWSAVEALIPG